MVLLQLIKVTPREQIKTTQSMRITFKNWIHLAENYLLILIILISTVLLIEILVMNNLLQIPVFLERKITPIKMLKIIVVKRQMEHPSEWANFSYGIKTTLTETDSDVNFLNTTTGTPVIDPTQSNEFIYSENINAVYADMSKPLGEKWQTKIGLRFENTRTKGVSKQTIKPIPTHTINYFHRYS